MSLRKTRRRLLEKKNGRDERAEDDCSASIGALEFSDEVVVRLEFGFVLTNPNL